VRIDWWPPEIGPTAEVRPADGPLAGACRVPGDKSICHRAALIGAVAAGASLIRGFSPAGDCGATLDVLAALGVSVTRHGEEVRIDGRGPGQLSAPAAPLDCRRSGTTMRLAAGLLAAAPFRSVLTGDDQLLRRPMERVAEPLRRMGARVELAGGGRAPMAIEGGPLTGIEYRLPVASSQVKAVVLLAGLQASGQTTVIEPVPTRDHTERLLAWLAAPVRRDLVGGAVRTTIRPAAVKPFELTVPGDLSSAAPLMAAAALVHGSDVLIRDVGQNPTRTGFLGALERMGAAVEVLRSSGRPEPRGGIRVRHAPLKAITVEAAHVPSVVDELPLLGLLGTQAEGVTRVVGASELRVKESDRIAGLVAGLRALGADAHELDDGFVVRGPTRLRGGRCDARADHRLAMTFAVAGLIAGGPVEVVGTEYLADSFPGFLDVLEGLR
jgi:3-phosphoshikimate 1-carboxyvinyltransferase